MTNNQLTDKRLAQLAKRNFCQTKGEEYTPFGDEVVSMAAELQERRKADSEPVAWTDEEELRDVSRVGFGEMFSVEPITPDADLNRVIPLYRHAQPAPELAAIVERLNLSGYEHEGGEVTPQNAAAIVDTLLQQLDDAVQGLNTQPAQDYPETLPCPVLLEPGMRFGKGVKTRLVLDAIQRRAEHYAELEAMTPEERAAYDERIEEFKALLPKPVNVSPDFDTWFNGPDAGLRVVNYHIQRELQESAWYACRAAMLQDEPVTTANKLGNSPAIPDTWIPVSERMPEDEQEVLTINRMGHRFVSLFDKHSGLFFDRLDAPSACCIEHVLVTHWMELPAAPQEVVNGQD